MRLLGLPLFQVVGVLECLWRLAEECCDEGNIGKFSDEEISDYIGWTGDTGNLIAALLASGWIDASTETRLEIHDWMDHCPEYIKDRVRKRRARQDKDLRAVQTGQRRTEPDSGGTSSELPPHVPSIPFLTNPNPPPPPAQPDRRRRDSWEGVQERMELIPVTEAAEAIATARELGCHPETAHTLLDIAERSGYGPGAIYKRFKIARPELAVNRGWPGTDLPEIANGKRAAAKQAKEARDAAVEGAERQLQAEATKAASIRETLFGPILDAKSRDELKAMCETN